MTAQRQHAMAQLVASDVNFWHMWKSEPKQRKLCCKGCRWNRLTWKSSPYIVDPETGYWEMDSHKCYCMEFDGFGFLLRDASTKVIEYETGRPYVVDYCHGRSSLKVTDDTGSIEETVSRFNVITESAIRMVIRHWRRIARMRSFSERSSFLPSAVRKFLRVQDVIRMHSVASWSCHASYGSFIGFANQVCERLFAPKRCVHRSFTRENMMQHDPLHADASILYLQVGAEVVIASCAAPWQVDANGWIWIMEAQSNNYGWLNPHVLQSALNAEHLVVANNYASL